MRVRPCCISQRIPAWSCSSSTVSVRDLFNSIVRCSPSNTLTSLACILWPEKGLRPPVSTASRLSALEMQTTVSTASCLHATIWEFEKAILSLTFFLFVSSSIAVRICRDPGGRLGDGVKPHTPQKRETVVIGSVCPESRVERVSRLPRPFVRNGCNNNTATLQPQPLLSSNPLHVR
ncbi:uncharacterized protein LY89DRAFT_679319 [Mollisia scopiformis]|uniref:Uncharacterized protein n=1 Tax=Mollisia scopiformis TaxID=149040 RepID=A0A194XUS2_MOLSC|nr:uncharacterized protein LY89DRAFT_679319 [Mollisia scopiformis]KUJ24070.1 hypothetical protein LY89DRAFT_679319 [Mollisia scopiformis]